MKFIPAGSAAVCTWFVVASLHVGAATLPSDGILDKKITLRLNDLPLGDALDVIASQVGCSFSYSSTLLGGNRRVTVHYTDMPLRDVLADLLRDTLGSIQVHGSRILLVAASAHVEGKITTAEGDPIPFGTVRVDGKPYGTTSREDGSFTLRVPDPGPCVLVATAVGYEPLKKTLTIAPGQSLQLAFTLHEATVQMNEVLVTADRMLTSTATRTAVPVRDLPMPVMIIEGRQLEMMGSRRLHEVLQEQTGLALTTDPSGASSALGLQVQGFDASYTMIMIDGQPLIGRNSVGILDLSRITIANIERIEIIKGTSAAVYGSDALAGVVNIITRRQPIDGPNGTAALRYGTNQTLDATFDGSMPWLDKRAVTSFSTNFYRTDGFDAAPETPGKTLPPFHSYSLQGKTQYRLAPATLLTGSARFASRRQHNQYDLDRIGRREDKNLEQDVNATAVLQNTLRGKFDLQTQYYFTQYTARATSTDLDKDVRVNENKFQQYFHRVESFASYNPWPTLKATAGIGGNAEILQASRYGNRRDMETGFAYLQTHYTPTDKTGILAGVRYDVHSLYGQQVSPRLGIRYTVNDWLVLKATAGTGFKAPSFQQLYLAFNNPSAGYTVLGASVFDQEVARMQAAGEIQELYPVAEQIGNLKAERSRSFNAGFVWQPVHDVTLEVNAFRNDIHNMILEDLVGVKQNRTQLYSYRNIDRAFTQGLETTVAWAVTPELQFSVGYQLLYAKDQGIVDKLKKGEVQLRTPEGRIRTARPSDYFNLTSRSRHMANAKIFYEHKARGISASVRATYRGKYGMGDRNYPNLFIDPYDLYADGYVLLNATVEKRLIQKRLGIQLICDNITDYNDSLIPNLPGRQLITALSWRFNKND
ncbi:TonB-dependent receptor domain-containing protein [Dawidia soli]|uniref:TonB-dependent receptor n=1 Tax=Dawidia soli TaxID=2782352 RepID=A0AAP2DBX5_9BACT|nr:TonB-dependent receptor [Dawidia soli]MBT1689053.1 TonB-dependent receptor [Dawidia soli]